jgi:hypothetical protein
VTVLVSTKIMSAKRQRTEEEEKLNDSLQTIISEIENKDDPSNKDLARLMGMYFRKSEELHVKIFDLQHQNKVLEEKVDVLEATTKKTSEKAQENSESVEILNHDVTDLRKLTLRNEMIVNQLEQGKRDNDIFMSGFPSLPDPNNVLQTMTTLYDIAPDSIAEKFAYEFTPRNPKANSTPSTAKGKKRSYYHMVISFKDTAAKKKFMATKREKGPLMFEQLQIPKSDSMDPTKTDTIRCTNRLSKFNLKVQRELMKAKHEGKVTSFQLHNGTFRLKEKEDSRWIQINTDSALEPYKSMERMDIG